MNPNTGLINYEKLYLEALDALRSSLDMHGHTPTTAVINHKLMIEKTSAHLLKFESAYLMIGDQIKNIKKKYEESIKNKMKVEIELNHWKNSRFEFDRFTANEVYYQKRYGIDIDKIDGSGGDKSEKSQSVKHIKGGRKKGRRGKKTRPVVGAAPDFGSSFDNSSMKGRGIKDSMSVNHGMSPVGKGSPSNFAPMNMKS
jgi:hypothetical protein